MVYCSAFRRLAEVTQVVSASEGYSFHNRLTHTLKVAQIARRLAERLSRRAQDEGLGIIDPDVVETAALVHDLGHPPFGHTAEIALDELAVQAGERDGFEGNAQSFRIVTKLAIRTPAYPGLNLTRATLNAVLKYPWLRATKGPHSRKWGVYHAEEAVFDWARGAAGESRSIEAELMDWADDIAYSVFDVDDFYRAGLIPLDRVMVDRFERDRFVADARARLKRWGKPDAVIDEYVNAFDELLSFFPAQEWKGRYQAPRNSAPCSAPGRRGS